MKTVKKQATSPIELEIVERDMCKKYHADAGMLLAWLGNMNRPPSLIAFERGSPTHRVAEAIEDHLRIDDNKGPIVIGFAIIGLSCFLTGVLATLLFCWPRMHKVPIPNERVLMDRINRAGIELLNKNPEKAGEILGIRNL